MAELKPGQQYRLLADHGNPPLHLRAGSIGTVREVVPAATSGAHNSEEDSAVLEFATLEVGYEGEHPFVATGSRAVAFALTDFKGEDALFEEAD